MITETLIALAIIVGVFVYIGLKSESTLLRVIFVSASLMLLMTFFFQMGLLYSSYQNTPAQYQLVLANTTAGSLSTTTIYHYTEIPITNTTSVSGYKQGAMNDISQMWYDWATVMGFVILIYLLIEYIAYKFVWGMAKQAQKSVRQ